ncbi:zona pellucida sperm-binding protein 4 isoform X2 [Oryzias latipes]|uniref:ZP domain-containing protein n=1 Tax=Oryzias latipes TaxID=8090 RepID=H2MZ89_ORYLA|nr:zona pellucida sperm-binding protein 4 isoform X2 [Oryzias latipes]
MNCLDFILLALNFLSLKCPKCDAWTDSRFDQTALYSSAKDNPVVCYDDLVSVHLSKEQFSNLPLTIYIQDERGGYYQAAAIASHCHYFFGETHTSVILTVAFHGCFVKRQESTTSLTVVIVAPVDGGVPEIVHSMKVVCDIKKTETKFPDMLKEFFCNKNGFSITIPRNATDPPLNLDAIWIPSDPNHNCKPLKRSFDALTYSFPFTDCGTQSKIANGNITYWITIEVKRYPQRGVIIRDTPFRLTVKCSFALTQMTQLGFDVQQSKADYPSVLKNKGVLRTEMRFAKDSSYRSFYSSGDPPTVAELGQLVFVEVFLKHQDEDLVLLLDDCWATPTEDPHDPYRWNLLVKGCPFSGDSHRTVLLPVSKEEVKSPSLHKWLVVKLFSFVKPSTFENLVYFHCNVEICKGPNCTQSCSNDNRKLRGISPEQWQRNFPSVVSGGPLLYLQ